MWMIANLLIACGAVCAQSAHTDMHLDSGDARLALERSGSGYSIALRWKSQGVWEQKVPVAVELVDASGRATWIEAPYQSAESTSNAMLCTGSVKTANGTIFRFEDEYRGRGGSQAFSLKRRVTVEHPAKGDVAFSTRFLLERSGRSSLKDCDILAPGVWYGRNEWVPKHAIGGDYSDSFFYTREDRLAAPFVMVRDCGGISLTVAHESPDARTFAGEDFLPRIIDERMQFGSLGLQKSRKSICAGFLFPGSEGEKTYIAGGSTARRWALRSHPVKAGAAQSYTLVLRLDKQPGYPQAVKSAWRYCYGTYKPPIVKADLGKVYADGVDLLAKYARASNGAPGFPFSIDMKGSAGDYNFQMGFVGGQILGGYHLYRSGVLDKRPERRQMGEAIVDFWVRESYEGRNGKDDLPHSWYQPVMPPGSGPGPHWGQEKTEKFWRDEPLNGQVFLRTLCEGHLAALRAWEFAHKQGIEHDDWLAWTRRYGDWLVRHQNADGSFYRKYKVTGEPLQMDRNNTAHPIAFLVSLHKATGDARYLTAAVAAGEFAWKHSHERANYAGGTPDNPNVTDKEAACIALNAFLALFDGTGDRKWLDAASRAADFAETWVYVWDVPVPGSAVFDRINTAGLSLVATGHSYADCFDASSAHDFHRLWKLTGDGHYRNFSELLFHNTKQLLDTNGSKGYAHPGLQVEGLGLSVIRGGGPKVWLPWVTLAQIDPISELQDDGGL